jgi:polar amino acid transport system substrate-binding protein
MRSPLGVIVVTALVAAMVSFGVMRFTSSASSGSPAAAVRESAYDRILRTGVIRCGYIVYPPYLLKDPNTGQMSGPAFDFMSVIAKELNVKLEWTEETGWGTFHEGLNGNRYDLMCVPVWQSGARARIALLSKPLYYNPVYAFARANDNRFDKDTESIDKPGIRIAVGDGNPTQETRRMKFPRTDELAVPDSADYSAVILNVATGKADVALENADNVARFNAASKDKLKVVGGGKPLRMFANVLAMRQGEFALKAALDSVIEAINNSGEASAIVQKYSPTITGAMPGYEVGKP